MKRDMCDIAICAWKTLRMIVVCVAFVLACTRSGDSELSWDELNAQVQVLINQAMEQARMENHDAEEKTVSKSIALTLKTIEAKERNARHNQGDLVKMHRLAGYLKELAGNRDTAVKYYERALEYAVIKYGSNHFEVAECLYWLATSSDGNRKGVDAVGVLGQAVGIMDKERERGHPAYNPVLHIRALDVYGRLLRERGAYAEGSMLFKKAIDIMDFMDYMPEEGLHILRSGTRFYMNNNMYTQALPLVDRQLAYFKRALTKDAGHPWTNM